MITAPTFEALADEVAQRLEKLAPWTGGFQLDPSFAAGLAATVERFNVMADEARDRDFHRGETPIEEVWAGTPRPGADGDHAPVRPGGSVSLRDPRRRRARHEGRSGHRPVRAGADTVRRADPGLYGAGNCIASPAGQAYWGAGGHRAGAHVRLHRRTRAATAPVHSPALG